MTSLLDVGPAVSPACPTCSLALSSPRARCRICVRGNIPRPGSPGWRRWLRGIWRVVDQRLVAAGLGRSAPRAQQAIAEGVPVPPKAAALLADIAALPVSLRAYQERVDRALLASQVETALRGEGMEQREAERLAREAARVAIERRRNPARVAVPSAPRLRVADVAPVDEAEAEAEREAVAIEETAPGAKRAGR